MHFLNAITLADQHRHDLEQEAARERVVRAFATLDDRRREPRATVLATARRGLGQAARFVSVRAASAADHLDPVERRVVRSIR